MGREASAKDFQPGLLDYAGRGVPHELHNDAFGPDAPCFWYPSRHRVLCILPSPGVFLSGGKPCVSNRACAAAIFAFENARYPLAGGRPHGKNAFFHGMIGRLLRSFCLHTGQLPGGMGDSVAAVHGLQRSDSLL